MIFLSIPSVFGRASAVRRPRRRRSAHKVEVVAVPGQPDIVDLPIAVIHTCFMVAKPRFNAGADPRHRLVEPCLPGLERRVGTGLVHDAVLDPYEAV